MNIVAFDVYRTLLDIELDEDSPAAYVLLSQWLAYQGISITPHALREQYKANCHKDILAAGHEHPDIDIGRVFSAIIVDAGGPSWQGRQDVVEQFAMLFRITTTVNVTICRGVRRTLEALSRRTRLGIISNAQRLFTIPELKRFGLLDYFTTIVFSSDVHACKPNRRIFDAFIRAAATTPGEVLFIGDNLADDVRGATQLGIKTVWVNRGTPKATDSGSLLPDFEIDGLEDERLTMYVVEMLSSGPDSERRRGVAK